jgi:hypothetical protein
MGARYGEYSQFQLNVLCGVAQGMSYVQIAQDLHKFNKFGNPDETSVKSAIYEATELRRERGIENKLQLIQDAYNRRQLTREQLAPGYNADASLSEDEIKLLTYINESGVYSDIAIYNNYPGLEGHRSHRNVDALRGAIGQKLFGDSTAPLLRSAVGYYVQNYNPNISLFIPKDVRTQEEIEENSIQAEPPILFTPQGPERGEALYRIRQQQEVAIIADIISPQDRKGKIMYPRPRILAVGGEDLAELLYGLSDRTVDEVYKGFLHDAVQKISLDGTTSSVPYIEKETREGTWRLYMLGKHLGQSHREVLGAYEDRLLKEREQHTLRRPQSMSL